MPSLQVVPTIDGARQCGLRDGPCRPDPPRAGHELLPTLSEVSTKSGQLHSELLRSTSRGTCLRPQLPTSRIRGEQSPTARDPKSPDGGGRYPQTSISHQSVRDADERVTASARPFDADAGRPPRRKQDQCRIAPLATVGRTCRPRPRGAQGRCGRRIIPGIPVVRDGLERRVPRTEREAEALVRPARCALRGDRRGQNAQGDDAPNVQKHSAHPEKTIEGPRRGPMTGSHRPST
jgi:hypothetical protein